MGQPLRILLVEDSPEDAEILLREIRRGGFEVEHERVASADAMRAALQKPGWGADHLRFCNAGIRRA